MKRNQQYKITDPSDDNTAAQHLDSTTVADNSDRQKHRGNQQKTTRLAFLGDSINDQQQVSLLAEDLQQHQVDQVDETQTSLSQQDNKKKTTTAANMLGDVNNGASNGSSGDHKSRRKATPPSSKSSKNQPILGDVEVEDIEANKSIDNDSSRSSRSLFRRYQTYIVMGLVAIAVVLFVILCKAPTTNKNDNCPHTFQPTKSHTLFATKTLYTVALNYLSGSASAFPIPRGTDEPSHADDSSHRVNPSMIELDHLASTHVPSIYSKLSLSDVHKIMSSQNCTVRNLYFVGRHGARLPSEDELKRINDHMQAIISKIYPHIETPTQSVSNIKPTSENKTQICHNSLIEYTRWAKFATPEQGNLLTETGAKETEALAKRLKLIYPSLFDAGKAEIHVKTTGKLRTAQTAINFIRQLDNYVPVGCKLSQYPSENTTDVSEAIKIIEDSCYKEFEKKHDDVILDFHHECDKMTKENDSIDLGLDLHNPAKTKFIVDSVSGSLGLSTDKQLSADEVKAIYDVCKYETALKGVPSIWCGLFDKKHMDFYEYLSDVGDYFNSTYGDETFFRSACPVTSDIYRTFSQIVDGEVEKLQARFYFSHSEVIQRIIAASVNLSLDPTLKPPAPTRNRLSSTKIEASSAKASLANQNIPPERDWRTSLLTPFSANMAFTLYQCPKQTDLAPLLPPDTFDVKSQDTYRVVASLNERPILLQGCTSYACSFRQARDKAQLFDTRNCDLASLCGKNITFT